MEFISKYEKADWGWRCTQDSSNKLRMGKKGNSIGTILDSDFVDAIKTTLPQIRGERGGAFWIKDKNSIVVVDEDDSFFIYKECNLTTGQHRVINRQRKPF